MKDSSRHIFTVVATSMGILLLLSAVPWSRLTGNRIKDFNLFEDLIPSERTVASAPTVEVDPELASFLAETQTDESEQLPAEPVADVETETEPEFIPAIATEEPPTDDNGEVLLEFYGDNPLAKFKAALASGTARVAVLGDSFIEGDIFTQNLREFFQDNYGGSGVGYMAIHSDFPGFRGSVTQSDKGWKMHDLRTLGARDSIRSLCGEYGKAESAATASYRGAKGRRHLDNWELSRFLFLSADSGTVTLTTNAGSSTHNVAPSGKVQCIDITEPTSALTVTTDIQGLVALGVYLDGISGVQLDCMSIRGNSGIGHRKMSLPLASDMRQYVDYDLIILEYGINALSGEQTDYTPYSAAMTSTVGRIKDCYPNADIIIMGIADRGVKDGTAVLSLPTCRAMVKAQRDVARRTGSAFWDTRSAMGGDNAIVDWRKRKLMNADYIHINHDGGRELARLFYNSLSKAIDE